ncbi:helix-turn-helix domain-containing protein [Streptomyces halstedii]|uniref:helix-turn-helix domain-containing protein n=1 Tax=Streptomyces halstedii TaxID=1944 RepID=UPI003359BD1D
MPPTTTADHDGARIRSIRVQRGYTITQLAHMVGKTPQTISNVERENKRCSEVLLQRIASALETDPSTLTRTGAPATALLTIPATARELGCSEMHVYRLIAGGQLRAVDISVDGSTSSKTRVRSDDLTTFVEGRTRQIPASA